ncbi:MAG: RES family NAD+ phosphorylase [Opitutales bacterium]
MLETWRIVTRKWAEAAFDGEGARLYGGRWNSPGRAVVYLADSRALAALESLVHHPGIPEIDYVRFPVRFKSSLVEAVPTTGLEASIRSPVVAPETQAVGDQWLRQGRKPVLEVPSAIIPEEYNYLLNPKHPKFGQIEIGAAEGFAFDPRLV